MKIGIIGMGHVGSTMHALLANHADLITYDVADGAPYPHEELAGCDFAIVCVNTPSGPDGTCDVTCVREAIKQLPTVKVLLKSTVAPGTTDRLIAETGKEICFSPEYVGESTYYNPVCSDAAAMPFVILGGRPATRAWFLDALLPVLGPTKIYFQCAAVDAEAVKYMENAFFATKITFVNEFRRICQALGADWHTVREGWLLDPRVEPSHTAVFTADPGFGGKCLPKDTRAIVAAAQQAGFQPHLLAEVLASNDRFRTPA
ncbi:UNVERIFIED_ORG: nucleotide sugar dehydrogenase [Microbispora rosea subsp. rosea]